LNTLNPQQRQAVETIHGPVLVLAGAGTGKTRVITTRVAYLLERGVAPGNVLAVTFTNKAAREMLERVNQLVPRPPRSAGAQKPERPTICTFHSLCARMLRQHVERLGYKRNFVIYDEAEQRAVVKRILSQISTPGEKPDPGEVLAQLSRQRNGSRPPAGAQEGAAALAQHIRPRYESALRACNAVDFDDLILLTLRLFEAHPDALAACQTKYQYVMVDEYQDTNAAQFRLVRALVREHQNLCVVGDDDQSIYGWRGAEFANLLNLERHFPAVKVVKLEQNYRSTTTILNAANALIKHNPRRHTKRLWSQKGRGASILLTAFQDDEEEAGTVVEDIECARLGRGVPWSQQAVLFRTNSQSRPLESALRKAGVSYHLVGGQSFFDRREVRDLMAYLKVFLNPHGDISLLRIANVPARGLSDATMQQLLAASQERKCSVFSAMQQAAAQAALAPRAQASISAFVQFVEQTRAQLQQLPAPDSHALRKWAEGFLAATGYVEELRRSEKDAAAAENRVRNLMDLVGSLDGQSAALGKPAQRLEQFLEELTLDTEREAEAETRGEAVTLITIHSCKGLEFPHVHIVGVEDGLLPHAHARTEGTLDEERRLFYVAITRAMETLSLSHCAARRKYGQFTPCQPSPFLKELPPHLLESGAARRQKPVSAEAGKAWFAALREAAGDGGRGAEEQGGGGA
jgi:superfamily I DNA/RNA helicase